MSAWVREVPISAITTELLHNSDSRSSDQYRSLVRSDRTFANVDIFAKTVCLTYVSGMKGEGSRTAHGGAIRHARLIIVRKPGRSVRKITRCCGRTRIESEELETNKDDGK